MSVHYHSRFNDATGREEGLKWARTSVSSTYLRKRMHLGNLFFENLVDCQVRGWMSGESVERSKAVRTEAMPSEGILPLEGLSNSTCEHAMRDQVFVVKAHRAHNEYFVILPAAIGGILDLQVSNRYSCPDGILEVGCGNRHDR